MSRKNKSSLAEINNQLLEKRREDYQIGYANIQQQAGTAGIDLGNEQLWQNVEKSTTKRTKLKWYNWFKWLFSKKTKVGRFGQKSVNNEKLEAIAGQMENDNQQGEYFDPMQGIYLDNSAYAEGSIGAEFHNLVTDEANLAQENDFHSELTEGGKGYSVMDNMARHSDKANDENELKRVYEEEYKKRHDVTKAFNPDGGVVLEGQPDSFAISVGVVGASRYYMEYTKESAKQKGTNEIKKMFMGSKVSNQEDKLIQSAMERTPLYKKLVEDGKKNNANYNPKDDPLIENLRAEIKFQKNMGSPGHAFIRLIPKVRNIKKASYSFGFCTTGPGKIGGVDEGTVENPDPRAHESAKTEKEYQIPYSGYLKAAAKIRGIMASGRKYSVLGYNCTSFAVEVAKSAGVSIPDEEVATDMTTFDSRSERVDIPAALQNFLYKERAKANEDEIDARLKYSDDKSVYEKAEKDHFEMLEKQRKEAYYNGKRAQWYESVKNMPVVKNIYKDVKDEKVFEDLFIAVENSVYDMDESKVKEIQDKYSIDTTKDEMLTPQQVIMDYVCNNEVAFKNIISSGVELPMITPVDYAKSMEKNLWEHGNSNKYADVLMNNRYFVHDVGCDITHEQAVDVLKKILDFEIRLINSLAESNGIRFKFSYDNPDEVSEAGQQRMKWQNVFLKVYGTEDMVGGMISVLEDEDSLRQYIEENKELMWSIKDYLIGI